MSAKEMWKEIKGYEGKYIISNYGKIIRFNSSGFSRKGGR